MNTAKKAAFVLAATGAIVGTAVGSAAAHGGGAYAGGKAVMSPGALSGNVIQAPIDIPINLVGNSVNVIGLLNPAFGNTGVNV
jgi:hypothetical protein